MPNEILSTGVNLLNVPGEGGTGDGKVKCNATDTADYLASKLTSSNDSIEITYLANEKKLSITMNNDYESVISPATNFPIMSCNASFVLPNHSVGISSISGCVNKINLPSGQIASIQLFGGANSSNNKHVSLAIYGSNSDDVQGSTLIGSKFDLTGSNYIFDIGTSPIKIQKYKFYWVMVVLSAESDGGDQINGMTTNITGAGIGTWQYTAGIGSINNPFSGEQSFKTTFDYTINYSNQTVFPYIQLNIVK